MLSALSSFVAVGALTPFFTMSACGGNNLTTFQLNDELPTNWTSDDTAKAVQNYANEIKTNSNEELIQELNKLETQLNDGNTSAYNGFDQIAFFEPFQKSSSSGLTGGWSLRSGKELKDVYDFYVSHSTNQIYPTWEYMQTLFTNHSFPKQSEAQKLNDNILLMQNY